METLAAGYGLLEAPVVEAPGQLVFSDLAGGIYRRTSDGEIHTLLAKRRGVGGMVRHESGDLIIAGRSLARLDSAGQTSDILAIGDGLTGFNDLHVAADGSLLVGVLRYRPLAGEQPVPGAVWLVSGRVVALDTEDLCWPNGIGTSPDGSLVYVADFHTGAIHRGPLDGPIRPWTTSPSGQADGLAVAADGSLFVALGSGGGIARYSPDGTLVTVIEVPSSFVSSVAFDGRDLYVTTAGQLFRTGVDVPGLAITPAT